MNQPFNFGKTFSGFGVVILLGSISFFLIRQHAWYNRSNVMEAKRRIEKARQEKAKTDSIISYNKRKSSIVATDNKQLTEPEKKDSVIL